jgi:hypothetical protein
LQKGDAVFGDGFYELDLVRIAEDVRRDLTRNRRIKTFQLPRLGIAVPKRPSRT